VANNVKVYRPAGRCIYCTNPGPYSKEHIIPYGLGGDQILPCASCRECRDITSNFERLCLREMFGDVRVKHAIQTRRPEKRPAHLPLIVKKDGIDIHVRNIPPREFPVGMVGFLLPEPGILTGDGPTTTIRKGKLWFGLENDPLSYPDGMQLGVVNPFAFEQMIAKIAHSFCVANYGLTAFRPILMDFIRGKQESGFYFVGGSEELPPIDRNGLHKMRTYTERRNGIEYLMTEVRLFCSGGAPTYFVVVGEV
jgi:hypothetical protein